MKILKVRESNENISLMCTTYKDHPVSLITVIISLFFDGAILVNISHFISQLPVSNLLILPINK